MEVIKIEIDVFIILILIGLSSGILSGMFGIGGGLLIIPALIYLCGFSQLEAQGTSLTVMLPPVGVLAFLQYYRQGHVNLQAGVIISICLLIGAFFGSKLALQMQPDALRKMFAIFMVLTALKLFFSK